MVQSMWQGWQGVAEIATECKLYNWTQGEQDRISEITSPSLIPAAIVAAVRVMLTTKLCMIPQLQHSDDRVSEPQGVSMAMVPFMCQPDLKAEVSCQPVEVCCDMYTYQSTDQMLSLSPLGVYDCPLTAQRRAQRAAATCCLSITTVSTMRFSLGM